MAPALWKKLSPTLLLAGLLVTFLAQTGGGFFAVFLIFALLILIPIRIFQAINVPATRQLQVARITVWLGAVVLILSVHYVRSEMLRHNADEILVRINAFSVSNGRCAANIEELGLSRKEMGGKLGYSNYQCEDGKQSFFYAATFVIFSTYHYDFNKHEWHFIYG